MNKWNPMSTAPKGGYPIQHVRLKLKDGTVHEDAHWASDLSGEDQPPFEGWFIPGGPGYNIGVENPIGWMPK